MKYLITILTFISISIVSSQETEIKDKTLWPLFSYGYIGTDINDSKTRFFFDNYLLRDSINYNYDHLGNFFPLHRIDDKDQILTYIDIIVNPNMEKIHVDRLFLIIEKNDQGVRILDQLLINLTIKTDSTSHRKIWNESYIKIKEAPCLLIDILEYVDGDPGLRTSYYSKEEIIYSFIDNKFILIKN